MNYAELYDRVLEAFNEDEGSFNAAARNWIEGTNEAPFEDPEAQELYAKAKQYCAVWRSGAINSRISKRRMVACVRQIAEKGLHNPYKEIQAGFRMLGVDPNEVNIVDEPEAIKGTTLPVEKLEKKVQEKKEKIVLGVVPEEKPKSFFKRHKE